MLSIWPPLDSTATRARRHRIRGSDTGGIVDLPWRTSLWALCRTQQSLECLRARVGRPARFSCDQDGVIPIASRRTRRPPGHRHFEIRQLVQVLLGAETGSQQVQHIGHTNAHAPNAWPAATLFRIDRNLLDQVSLSPVIREGRGQKAGRDAKFGELTKSLNIKHEGELNYVIENTWLIFISHDVYDKYDS